MYKQYEQYEQYERFNQLKKRARFLFRARFAPQLDKGICGGQYGREVGNYAARGHLWPPVAVFWAAGEAAEVQAPLRYAAIGERCQTKICRAMFVPVSACRLRGPDLSRLGARARHFGASTRSQVRRWRAVPEETRARRRGPVGGGRVRP